MISILQLVYPSYYNVGLDECDSEGDFAALHPYCVADLKSWFIQSVSLIRNHINFLLRV